MATLHPQSLELLLRRLAHELAYGACFDLPGRSFHRAAPEVDLGVWFHGERAGSALGPAAGPQSQLAQNLVLAYLGGGRVFELKTVQVLDELELPRPCIDAQTIGYNVEWSQELRLEQSRAEYLKAWVLLHALRRADLGLGLAGAGGEFLFDLSVGYDLAGVKSKGVRAFLEGMLEARSGLDGLFQGWPKDLLAWRPEREAVPDRVSSNVTVSTFHGCPPEEVEAICEHLLVEVGTNVVVKFNPTLLGFEEVSSIINDRLGYREVRLHRPSFEKDLRSSEAVGLVRRLQAVARAHGRIFGAKLTNSLVVENHREVFPRSEALMYLSGAPLHLVALESAWRLREAVGGELPISFSGGVDAKNFADCVAAGFSPVTTCTDLLRPGGYGRLPRYLEALASRMKARAVSCVPDFILAEAGCAERLGTTAPAALPPLLESAARQNHAAALRSAGEELRYRAERNRATPRKVGTRLWLFDCLSCDKCLPACPNDANFSVRVPEALLAELRLPDLVVRAGALQEENERLFALEGAHQLATYADFCNECGNCDTFCPEDGGPYLVKPRFFASRQRLEESAGEGLFVERKEGVDRIVARHGGPLLELEVDRARTRARFSDEWAQVELSFPEFARLSAQVRAGAPEGHRLRLDVARALAALLCGVLAPGASSPVAAPYLPAHPPPQGDTLARGR